MKHMYQFLNIIDAEPKHCFAVIIRNDVHQVYRYVRPCTDELPAVCADTDMSSAVNSKLYVSFSV